MRLTFRQRFDFGSEADVAGESLIRPEAWDALRASGSEAFGLAATREQLNERAATNPELQLRARAVADAVRSVGGSRVASYGVGTGGLEALLEDEGLELSLTEYAPRTVERLRALFPDRRVELHDLLVDGPLDAVDVHLFHRIDTELNDAEWRKVFQRFAGAQVIVVAAGVVTPRAIVRQLLLRVRRRGAASGWIRTESSLQALWTETHSARASHFADLAGWVLRP